MADHISPAQDPRSYDDSVAAMLRQKGIEPTVLRVKIAAVLLTKIQHLTVTQIRQNLKHNNNMISDIAMTNTLRLFSKHQIIREIIVDPKTIFYDSNTCIHPHFYNKQTGGLVDIPTNNIRIYDAELSLASSNAS